jgi:hypothetical protein
MATYATVADVEARWRPLSASETTLAETLLGDAAVMLDSMVDTTDPDERLSKALTIVSANMVIRSLMATTSDSFGVSQTSIAGGPYSQTYTYSNPTGDLYVTRQEKKMLGCGSSRVGWAPLVGGRDD